MSTTHLPDRARVWVYQANRSWSEEEEQRIAKAMDGFVSQWKAHGAELAAGYDLIERRWLVLAVDELQQAATGCSIDSSVHLIRDLGEALKIDFFNRTLIIWEDADRRHEDAMHDFWAKRKAGIVNDETVVFNTLAKDLGEFRSGWKQRFAESWHAEMWK